MRNKQVRGIHYKLKKEANRHKPGEREKHIPSTTSRKRKEASVVTLLQTLLDVDFLGRITIYSNR